MTNHLMIYCCLWGPPLNLHQLAIPPPQSLSVCLHLGASFPSENCKIFFAKLSCCSLESAKDANVQPRVKAMTHLKRDIPISINNGVWGRIRLHTGISGCDLFSQGAVHIPTRLRMKPPLPIVPVVTWGYLKSLQTNSWQMRWNSWFMKIWTWARLQHEKSVNAKLGWAGVHALMLQYLNLHSAALPLLVGCHIWG